MGGSLAGVARAPTAEGRSGEGGSRGRADGEEFSGFISGEFSLYGSYTDLIVRQRGEWTPGRRI